MNDKDKEELNIFWDRWRKNWEKMDYRYIPETPTLVLNETWQAACEYKDKEYSNIMDAMTRTSQYNSRLQSENKKLRKALEFYADATNNPKQYMRQGYLVYNLKKAIFVDGGTIAREALKEVEDK